MQDVVEHIWSNYLEGTGPCEECPNRDQNHRWRPFYGGGSKDADLAFIAITPGGNRKVQSVEPDAAKNRPERHIDLDNWNVDRSRKMFSRFLIPVLESVPQYNSNVKQALNEEIYYTNGKKCADIKAPADDDTFGSKGKLAAYNNAQAYNTCHQYLKPELEFVNPKVIVTAGKRPWKALCNVFSESSSGNFGKEFALKPRKIGEYTVIPSYHWNRLGSNYKHVDMELQGENHYIEELGRIISEQLDQHGIVGPTPE
ncbi:uracil-DNA glycosylase family protein [Haloprofundus salinisoli]|uniref:uracil-DNA glycosylase family protein n=1 Tax=Haloprofundus salinisoli TaxID=2876193 RepID=UPI001CD02F91|nr:uracil-DNA glycosylase family protein [Haloprofundus salinisoli]